VESLDEEPLEAIGYSMPRSCNLCEFSKLGSKELGRCTTKNLVIHKAGSCLDFVPSEIQLVKLGFFRRFAEFPA